MKTYDLYLHSPDDQIIVGWHSFDAESDDAAITVAIGLAKQAPLELWQESALVKRWEQPPTAE